MRSLPLPLMLLVLAMTPPSTGATSAQAPTVYQREQSKAREKAMAACVAEVRKQSGSKGFDAYQSTKGVHYFGTPEESFKFEKCMSKRGFDNLGFIPRWPRRY